MKFSRTVRLLLVFAIVLATIAIAGGAISVAGSLADVWDRLRDGPLPVFVGLIAFVLGVATLAGWLVWRLLFPQGRRDRKTAPPIDETTLALRVEEAREQGLDISAAETELRELARRREAGGLYLCVFGEIGAGKSSLIRALVPDADARAGVTGGTTKGITHYRWQTDGGDEVILADVPGSGLEPGDDEAGLGEAIRAHVVVYVSEADLTRRQFDDLAALAALEKPMILVLNKTDRYSDQEANMILSRFEERLREVGADRDALVVSASAIGEGESATAQLRQALQRLIDSSPEALDVLRDRAVFHVVDERLGLAERQRRAARAGDIVRGYTRKAIIGALAAVSPGTDVLIQGYLGTAMVRELCQLYEVPARDVEISRLLDLSQSYVGRTLPILLAVAGNALKAFPGVGTIAGGVTHAVAYGLIFDALGRGLSMSLAEGGELRPAAAAQLFRESLGEDLKERTFRIAQMALEGERGDKGDRAS
ncbi:MAG: 50S ribosome-binding GTPase [Gammaproteobacteria bacterium]|nr:MAG: 50S ribosome-binding GTPase [Gammaproteobacteria bacterium]